ncbi:hypothetical protein [Tautonia plasticadhaerens]|uniref:Uncharacterized protein n=1 Tax=Tautonia plasticadhaerens TaxID=2527974 RepID=A0A518GZH0_9BACT|nr:hypothetical protein [Tautonia plasticadhaerens]QDV33973.1 hypothetical protein ElP_18540 [Tautonia plasticadhaerens]
MPRVAVLLHLYLVVRIICCPCLTGQNVHDMPTRSLFAWGGAESVPSDDLTNPEDRASEAGACMCDGATSTTCPDCPPADRTGVELTDPGPPVPLCSVGLAGLLPDRAARPPTPPPVPLDAMTVRALLQNFRC